MPAREASLGPREASLGPREAFLGPTEASLGAREAFLGPTEASLGAREVLWRPKNEDSSIKMKRFGSNLFNLMELSYFFGRGRVPRGFPGVLRAAGTFSGQKRPLEGAGKNPIWPESHS